MFSAKHLSHFFISVIRHSSKHLFISCSFVSFTLLCFHLSLALSIYFNPVYSCKSCDSYSSRELRQIHAVFPVMQSAGFEKMFPTLPVDVRKLLTWVCTSPSGPCSELVRAKSSKAAERKQRLKKSMSLDIASAILSKMGSKKVQTSSTRTVRVNGCPFICGKAFAN